MPINIRFKWLRPTSHICAVLALSMVACHSQTMDAVHGGNSDQPLNIAPDSPYQVELVGSGTALPTYAHSGRYYVLGQVGQRYGIRVTNPTAVRVEAVISVDGLDVIDGEAANTSKRGYVIAPHGSITVDGFRVSNDQVAAFRFSSVSESYAGRKGVARNVGAIGVAIFSERARQPLVLPENQVGNRDRWEDEGDDDDARHGGEMDERRVGSVSDKSADRVTATAKLKRRPPPRRPAPAPTGGTGGTSFSGGGDGAAPAAEQAPPPHDNDEIVECCVEPRRDTSRPGLGTEYGERRHSSVDFTRFVRMHPSEPTAYAELRYNNAAGLAALGINTGDQQFDDGELSRRETAEPFPGQRFAEPPR